MRLFWGLARLLILLVGVPLMLLQERAPDIDWRLSLLFAAVGSIGLFVWLSSNRYQPNVDWSTPYAWKSPFLPLTRYPLQFWIVTSYSSLILGLAGLLGSAWFFRGNWSVSLMFVLVGIFLLITLHIWMKLFLKRLY